MTHISVICPTYNSAGYIEKTLASLLIQTVLPDEVVFSDDGSQDATCVILERWCAKFQEKGVLCQVLRNPHEGPGATRNSGIRRATGDWVAFLDADDLWMPDKLVDTLSYIQNNPGVNFLVHWEEFLRLNQERWVLPHGSCYTQKSDLPRAVFLRNAFSTSAVVCRKSIVMQVGGFDPTFPVSQDYELWLRLSPMIRLGVIEKILGVYVEASGSITAKPYHKRYYHLMRILMRHWRKGGFPLFAYRVLRATCSPEWLRAPLRRWKLRMAAPSS